MEERDSPRNSGDDSQMLEGLFQSFLNEVGKANVARSQRVLSVIVCRHINLTNLKRGL